MEGNGRFYNLDKVRLTHLYSCYPVISRVYFMPSLPASIAPENLSDVKKLYNLRSKIGLSGTAGFRARVAFATTTVRCDLCKMLDSYQLWDAGFDGLGPRQFDTCFEMGDGDDVGASIVKDARTHGYAEKVKEQFSERVWSRWVSICDAQGCLAL